MTDWDRFHIVSAQQLRRTSNILDKVVRKRKKIHTSWSRLTDKVAESLSLIHFEAMKMNCRCDTTKYIVDNFYMHQRTFHNVHWWCRIMIIYFNNTRFTSFSKNTSQQESIRSFYRYKLPYNTDRGFLTWMDQKIEFRFYSKKCFRSNMDDDPCQYQLETNQDH